MLLFAIATGIAAYLLFHFVPVLSGVAAWYAPHNNTFLPSFMFLILYTTFCKVDFRKLSPVKWHLPAIFLQTAFTLFTVWIICFLNVRGHGLVLLESVLVCVISPCAAAAAVVTSKLGGSLEETTSYIFMSNILSALLIPLLFPLLPRNGGGQVLEFLPLFLRILAKVSAVLLLPMLLAFLTKHFVRPLHRLVTGVRDLGYYLWSCSLVIVSGTTAMNIAEAADWAGLNLLLTIALLSLAVCLVQFAVGRFAGRHVGKPVDCGQALGQKNTSVAIWIATVFLNPLASVGPGCYILWQNTVNAVELVKEEKKERK